MSAERDPFERARLSSETELDAFYNLGLSSTHHWLESRPGTQYAEVEAMALTERRHRLHRIVDGMIDRIAAERLRERRRGLLVPPGVLATVSSIDDARARRGGAA
ncbi:hypothetical protein CLV35_1275 [Motilibacter peucedani]|uniref:Uncharacterized protein n=1 Tax=Motilibacter peucedani TaxID=598650 RepID=A0A420XRU5_9ACTN|nr:hypothetical protein [Motilibacter peucedani]RKS77582.1 hypothetical protein CLV35_1275 [Motilibacter peucedani]